MLQTRHYQSQSEVVREGLRLIKEREESSTPGRTAKEIAIGQGMKRFVVAARARQDVNDIWGYIANDNIQGADRVLDASDRAMIKLAMKPGIATGEWSRPANVTDSSSLFVLDRIPA
jgi:hypothetical protein